MSAADFDRIEGLLRDIHTNAIFDEEDYPRISFRDDADKALTALASLRSRVEALEKALRIAGGDFLRAKDRIERGEYGAAASIAYDGWYACAVAAPGFYSEADVSVPPETGAET